MAGGWKDFVSFHQSVFYEPFDFLCSLVVGWVKNLLIPNKQVFPERKKKKPVTDNK